MAKIMSEEQQEQCETLGTLTVRQFLEATQRNYKSSEIIKIEENFNVAFENLSDKAKSIVTKKKLCIGLENGEGELFGCSITKEGVFAINPIFDDIVDIHLLKNRFVIKETDFELYLIAPRYAMLKGMSAVGAIQTVTKLKKDKELLLCVLDENNIPILYKSVCDNFKKVTKLSNNVYLVQEKDFLIAVTTGVVIDSMNIEPEEDISLEYDRSYV